MKILASQIWIIVYLGICLTSLLLSQVDDESTHNDKPYDSTFTIQINPSLPSMKVQIEIVSLGGEDPSETLYKADFKNKISGKIIQKIRDTTEYCGFADYEFVDMNFDNYLDLRFAKYIDMSANITYHYWLFDKQKKKYLYNKEFSELLVGELSIDSLNKVIISTGRIGCAGKCVSSQTYSIVNEKLLLVEKTVDEEEDINGELQIVSKHFRRINGEMKQIE